MVISKAIYYLLGWAMRSKNDQPPRETLAKNLRFLKERFGYTDAKLGKASGVAPKTINNMYNSRTDVQLEKVDAVAKVFGLNLWHMIMPNLPDEYENLADFDALYDDWVKSSSEGRKHILMVAERESKYNTSENE